MRPRVVIAVCLAVLATGTSAQASFRIVNETGAPTGGQLQQWASALPYGHGDVRVSYTNPLGLEEPLYTSAGEAVHIADTTYLTRYAFAHELAHHIDYGITDAMREFIMRHILYRTGPWRSDLANSPHEQFAEAVVQATMRRAPRGGYNIFLGPQRRALLRRVLASPTHRPELLEGLRTAHMRRVAATEAKTQRRDAAYP